MTSASELFCKRRSRVDRNTTLDLGLDSSVHRTFHNHSSINRRQQHQKHNNNNTRRDRHDLDGCDPLRRSAQIRHHHSHRPSTSERDVVRLDEGGGLSSSGNNINVENFGVIRNSSRFGGNGRLPGAVLLARERLLERLTGVSLSRNRQNSRASSGINSTDLTFGDEFRLVDAGDWDSEMSRELLAGGFLFVNSVSQTDQLLMSQETSKRRCGLTPEALNCLQLEVFNNDKHNDRQEKLSASQECGICLESFVEGDELIRLPCAHRFHSSCLDPWVRTCGDCPYCRRGIVVTCN